MRARKSDLSGFVDQQLFGFGFKPWQIVSDSFPDGPMINRVVAVYEAISKRNRMLAGADSQERLLVFCAESNESFPDDFEFSFYGRTQHFVFNVVVVILASGELLDLTAGNDHVKQKLFRLELHKRVDAMHQ